MNRALLVGINEYPQAPLRGCVNDIEDMAVFLVDKCGFRSEEIRLLADARATTEGILERLGWLLSSARKGDRILFHYSGHGAQMPTRNPQGEVDGLDEVICPVDFDWSDEYVIRDKDFHRIFSAVPEGVQFVWISDSCHSGDLTKALPPAHMRVKSYPMPADIAWRLRIAKEKEIELRGMARVAAKLNVALISGCKSNQTSADADFESRANGALTYFLLRELKGDTGLNEALKKAVANVGDALERAHFDQVPGVEGSSTISGRAFLEPLEETPPVGVPGALS